MTGIEGVPDFIPFNMFWSILNLAIIVSIIALIVSIPLYLRRISLSLKNIEGMLTRYSRDEEK